MQYAEGREKLHETISALKAIDYDYSNSAYCPLPTAYSSLDELRREIPRLIIEHNLHGIDIDPRAMQIAALALWLRAQKAWKNLGIKAAERPRVARSNIVTAEPMPGEEDMKEEFTAGLKPRVLGQLVDTVFDKMKLAGEAGSLLKIEEEIKDAVAEAKAQWLRGPRPEQQLLFPGMGDQKPKQHEFQFDFKGVTDEGFWEQAEDRILDSLKQYSEDAENGRAVRRRLFAEDAARGFAFVDLSRKRYDVLLMNPPYGEQVSSVRYYTNTTYSLASHEIFSCFFQRALDVCTKSGIIGGLTSRTFLTFSTFSSLRKHLLSKKYIFSIADLGFGVLDGAMVETAASVIYSSKALSQPSTMFRLLKCADKQNDLQLMLNSETHRNVFDIFQKLFLEVPGNPLCYWSGAGLRRAFKKLPSFEQSGARPTLGLVSGNNDRFLRLRWETSEHLRRNRWIDYCKGGDYTKYYDDPHLVVDWRKDGKHIEQTYGQAVRLRDPRNYFEPGVNYPLVTVLGMNARLMPAGCIFDNTAPTILQENPEDIWIHLAYVNTRTFEYLVRLLTSSRHWQVGYLRAVPFPYLTDSQKIEITQLVKKCLAIKVAWDTHSEISHFFCRPLAIGASDSIRNHLNRLHDRWELSANELVTYAYLIDELIISAFNFGDEFVETLDEELEYNTLTYVSKKLSPTNSKLPSVDVLMTMSPSIGADPHKIRLERVSAKNGKQYEIRGDVASLISYMVGCILGRWDIRQSLTPTISKIDYSDALKPLPICPLGMLQGPDGRPALPEEVPSSYPINISRDGILVEDGMQYAVGREQFHKDDIVMRVREVLEILWPERSDRRTKDDVSEADTAYRPLPTAYSIEQEACDILGVSDLRTYFRKPGKFFQAHLKRYSKSRRKAPIYWPLSTASGSYTIWIYYHRLTDQTLYTAVNQYVELKISEVERGLARIEDELKVASGGEATRLRDRLNETQVFLGELRDLREELLRIAALPYKPNLNDGVIINAAPFHKLFKLRSWANDTKKVWDKLEKGDYDWAHLAYTIWPDRVREVCKKDRSIAIAHGLEDLCEAPTPKSRSAGRRQRTKS